MIGIIDNPSALHMWITAGPEVVRIIDKFEKPHEIKDIWHHDQSLAVQSMFAKHGCHMSITRKPVL